MREIVLIAHNVRSCHNVGSLLRTAEGLGIKKVFLTGYSPYPLATKDQRLPHLATKMNRQIQKTALGAESLISWEHKNDIISVITNLKNENYVVYALEQTDTATLLPKLIPSKKVAIIVGREVEGIETEVLELADQHIQIPMLGKKESFNVVQAAAMALYHCRFMA